MEFVPGYTKLQIASLVLGYLKSEKCCKAFNEFLEESPFFQKHKHDIKLGKYFVTTRVGGMSLLDLLEEYAAIYSIVQAHLEASSYYEEHSKGGKANLVEQILYLLERKAIANSTPFSVRSEVETTPVHTLPGHNESDDSEDCISKTPKRKSTRSRSTNTKNVDKDDAFDVSEVLTQTLLENHELHEKIAETINIVRNTPENSKTVSDEHISAGASKELDAIIKTVVQRTEEDPLYNKLIDEIIGTAPFDNAPTKKQAPPISAPTTDEARPKRTNEIDELNNDAVRSIIAAAQNPPPQPAAPEEKPSEGGEVFVFDGTLDTYLKSSNQVAPNPVYMGGLIVMPPEPKQFYIVNNQPLINMNVSAVKGMITDNDIMAMPTIIVNDETRTSFDNQTHSASKNPQNKRTKTPRITPKPTIAEVLPSKEAKKGGSEPAKATPTTKVPTPRHASHVRNLDFSTPHRGGAEAKPAPKKAWDADLRSLAVKDALEKSPKPKRKRPVVARSKKKPKAKNKFEESLEKDKEEETKNEEAEEEKKEEEKENHIVLATPVKNTIPKTPGADGFPSSNSFHCTPFTDVLEEHLKGVDLISLPTPKLPITPGLGLTPGDLIPYNNRSTDYSTSSSYYQPSDTEQNKSLDQLIEECKKLEKQKLGMENEKIEDPPPPPPPQPDKFSNLKILSDVVIEQAKIVTKKEEHLKKFNHSIIGKKNLNLLNPTTSSSSCDSDSSDTESEKSGENSNKTVINKETKKTDAVSISSIISTVEMKNSLVTEEDARKKNILTHLEAVRQRTINKLKDAPEAAKKAPIRKKPPVKAAKTPKVVRRKSTKKEDSVDENAEAQKLVTDLAQRGIHLVPTKTPKKNAAGEDVRPKTAKKKNAADEEEKPSRKKKPVEKKSEDAPPKPVEEKPSKRKIGVDDAPSKPIEEKSPKKKIAADEEETSSKKKKPVEEKTSKKNEDAPPKPVEEKPSKRKIAIEEKSPKKKISTRKAVEEKPSKKIVGDDAPYAPSKLIEEKPPNEKIAVPKPLEQKIAVDDAPSKPIEEKPQEEKIAADDALPKPPIEEKEPEKKIVADEAPPKPQDDEPQTEEVVFDTKTYEDFEMVTHEEKRSKNKNAKTYDFDVLKKGFEATLFVEELQKDVVRVMRATNFEMLADLSADKNKSEEDAENDFLMDYVFIGSVSAPPAESPESKPSKGGKKRKSRSSEDDPKQTEKKFKTLEKNIKLLKKIDVDSFLDKVHGE